MKLKILNTIPEGFFRWPVKDLFKHFQGPAIIHLDQDKGNPLFVSTLLHGNEHSGFLAIQKILKNYHENKNLFKRSLIVFIGNTKAAELNFRKCEGENDFNRVWSGGECELSQIAHEVKNYVFQSAPFACIDIHNNTGINPFYSCITHLGSDHLELARFFAEKIVYFTEPSEVLSNAFIDICPSITVEAGQSGEREGIEKIYSKILELQKIESLNLIKERSDYKVLHTIARIKISKEISFDFNFNLQSQSDLSFLSDIDCLNFKKIKKGHVLAHLRKTCPLVVENNYGENVLTDFFEVLDNKLILKKEIIPAMFTKDVKVIREDCMGYIMEEYPHN